MGRWVVQCFIYVFGLKTKDRDSTILLYAKLSDGCGAWGLLPRYKVQYLRVFFPNFLTVILGVLTLVYHPPGLLYKLHSSLILYFDFIRHPYFCRKSCSINIISLGFIHHILDRSMSYGHFSVQLLKLFSFSLSDWLNFRLK